MLMIGVFVDVYFRGRLHRGEALAGSVDAATAQTGRQRGGTELVLALVLVYAVSAEWLGSVAGITGAYLLGYVFAGSEYKTRHRAQLLCDWPRTC